VTTNAELAVHVRELRVEVEHLSELVDQGVRVQPYCVTDALTGEQIRGAGVVLGIDQETGVAYVAPLALPLAVPLDQLK
jgi:thiazole synthase ThiGH ThiG subunit